jgi:hypothetical protein
MSNLMLNLLVTFAAVAWGGFLVYWFATSELRRHGHNPLEFDADENQSKEDQHWAYMSVEQGARHQ